MSFISQLNIIDQANTAIVFDDRIKDIISAVYEGRKHMVSPTRGQHGWFVCADVFNEARQDGIYGIELDQIFNQNINNVSVMPIKDAVFPDEVLS